jgi:ribosomal protein L11 methyltransferase
VIRLALRVPAEHAEVVLAELLALVPAGVEEVQPASGGPGARVRPDGSDVRADVGGAMVEYAVYGSPGELPELPDLRAAAGAVPIEVSTTRVPDDWSERWKRFHRPALIEGPAHSLHVRPPWAPPSELGSAHEIVIDPGQAFGTGAHATTRMCLELLLELAACESARGPALDVGSGSGVLAISAARLGYGPIVALDVERESIEAITANAAANSIALQPGSFEARRFDLRHERPPAGAQLVLANLLRGLLLSLCSSMADDAALRPAHLIASGLLREEADAVAAAFAQRLSLRERKRRERGEWAALWLSRAR